MSVRNQLRAFIDTNFYLPEPDSVGDDDSLIELGFIDSTGVMELIDFLDSSLGVTVSDAEIVPENLGSISRILAFVERKRGPTDASAPAHVLAAH